MQALEHGTLTEEVTTPEHGPASTKRRNRRRTLAALSLGAALAVAVPIGQAVAESSPSNDVLTFTVNDPARLVAKGVGVEVSVSYTCAAGATTSIGVYLSQRLGGGTITNGSGAVQTTCDGTKRTGVALVRPNFSYNLPMEAFKSGTALVTAQTYVCTGYMSCGPVTEEKAISIRK